MTSNGLLHRSEPHQLDSETPFLSGTALQMVKLPGEALTADGRKPDPAYVGQVYGVGGAD